MKGWDWDERAKGWGWDEGVMGWGLGWEGTCKG